MRRGVHGDLIISTSSRIINIATMIGSTAIICIILTSLIIILILLGDLILASAILLPVALCSAALATSCHRPDKNTPDLPTNIIPTNIARRKLSHKFPIDIRIPPLRIKIVLESSPPKSTMLVRGLGVTNHSQTNHTRTER